jgi:nucleotide-binding universal stress UspA family protein
MTILAATDFSPCSLTATRLAVAMARRRHAPVILLHTIEPLAVDPLAAPLSGEWEAAMVTAAEEALKSQEDDLRKSGLVVDVQVQVGTAAGSILEAAAAAKAELIVLGTHGRRGPARLPRQLRRGGGPLRRVPRARHGRQRVRARSAGTEPPRST